MANRSIVMVGGRRRVIFRDSNGRFAAKSAVKPASSTGTSKSSKKTSTKTTPAKKQTSTKTKKPATSK